MMEFIEQKISNPGTTCFWEPGAGLRFCLCDLGLLWLGVEKVEKVMSVGSDLCLQQSRGFYYNLQQLCKTILDHIAQLMYIHIFINTASLSVQIADLCMFLKSLD